MLRHSDHSSSAFLIRTSQTLFSCDAARSQGAQRLVVTEVEQQKLNPSQSSILCEINRPRMVLTRLIILIVHRNCRKPQHQNATQLQDAF